MEASIVWKKNLCFETQVRSHRGFTDSPGVDEQGPSPKELLLIAVIGCSGMDVVSLLKKMRSPMEACSVHAEATTRAEHPKIFPQIRVRFEIKGEGAKPEVVEKAVRMSMEKYCGVSAMVDATSPIKYQVFLNGVMTLEADADFTQANAQAKAEAVINSVEGKS